MIINERIIKLGFWIVENGIMIERERYCIIENGFLFWYFLKIIWGKRCIRREFIGIVKRDGIRVERERWVMREFIEIIKWNGIIVERERWIRG